jgi:hypothetical protein
MRHVSRLWLCLFLGLDASGTRWLPPTLPELVAGSDHIGIVEIRESEAYDVTDDEGAIPCGVLYRAKWVDSLTDDSGEVEFTSSQVLEVRTLYLVYLARSRLPPSVMSTNSWSEARRERNEARLRLCTRSDDLPRTIFSSAGFLNEENTAENFKTGTWVEDPGFTDSDLEVITIFPSEISIAGERIPRDRFLEEFHDQAKHQVLRTAGYSLLIFRAVDWQQYCKELITLAAQKRAKAAPNSAFCAPKPQQLPY